MFTLVARKNDATPISCRYSVLNLAFDKHLKVNGMGIRVSRTGSRPGDPDVLGVGAGRG